MTKAKTTLENCLLK